MIPRAAKDLYAAFFGRRYLHQQVKQEKASIGNLIDAFTIMDKRFTFPNFHAKEALTPIFIFSAGWRSGSTYLQRLICSNDNTLIWGEPFGDTGLLRHLASPLGKFTATTPPDSFFINDEIDTHKLKETWIANLYPTADDLRCAYREMLDQLFMVPAKQRSVSHWGLKEVRVDAGEAGLFRWLYPQCKLIFLVRNPIDAYRSYSTDKTWFDTRPDRPIITARHFATHWNRLASSYIQHWNQLGGILVRYEDLNKESATIETLEEYLGYKIAPELFSKVIAGTANHSRSQNQLLFGERSIINRICKKSMRHLEYH